MKNSDLINFKYIPFSYFYLIKNDLVKSNIYKTLDIREQLALDFIENIITEQKTTDLYENATTYRLTVFKDMLKWILETGENESIDDKNYDEMLDMAAILLAKEFKDESILSIIVEMIFKRNSKGLLIHDLVWGFFESHNLITLSLVAEKLKSANEDDFQLACKLLNLHLANDFSKINKKDLYTSFMNWLNKNSDFLYFTGESYQQKSNPVIYTLNHEAKYLCRKVNIDNGVFLINNLCDYEKYLLHKYRLLDVNTKLLIENYSLHLSTQSPILWRDWIACPISEQVKIAQLGGCHDLYI
jgi:hypothetical protein